MMNIQIVKGRRTLNASKCMGYRGDVLRSFLQKAIRRGSEENALYAASMLYALGTQENNEHPRESKMFLTNLMNRLLIIMVEDVGIAQPTIVEKALPLFQLASSGSVEQWVVANLVSMMCHSQKIRLLSDWGIMWKPYKVERIRGDPEFGPLFFSRYDTDYQEEIRRIDSDDIRNLCITHIINARNWMMNNMKSDMWIMKYVERIIYLVSIGDHLAMYYAMVYFVCNPNWKLRGNIDNRKKPIYLLFKILENFMRHESNAPLGKKWADQIRALNMLHRTHSTHKEASLLLLNAMLYCLDRDKLLLDNSLPEVDKSMNLPIPSSSSFIIPDYACDKHTAEGRGKGKSSEDFAISGALVMNEAKHLVDPMLRKLYHSLAISTVGTKRVTRHPWTLKPVGNWYIYGQFKSISDDEASPTKKRKKVDSILPPFSIESPRESIMMHPSDVVRVQVLTNKHKPDVYLTGNGMFVKGPYLSKDKCQIPLELNNKTKLAYCGIHTIPNMRIEYWIPDVLSDNPENFGIRTKVEPGKAYPFLVMDDLAWRVGQKSHPKRKYGTIGTSWAENTMLLDMSKTRIKHLNLMELPKSLYDQLWFVLIFRYIFQITDTCERNILIQDGQTIYSVDEETFAKSEKPLMTLFKKPLTGKRLMAMKNIMRETDWVYVETVLLSWLNSDDDTASFHVKERLNKIVNQSTIPNELSKLL